MTDAYDVSPKGVPLSQEFIARRLQSLAGFAFLLFLCEHLFTNSKATLFLGDDGRGFIDIVNWIHSLPYLPLIEISLIGLPIVAHVWWGMKRLHLARLNSFPSDKNQVTLAYSRNQTFSFQRISALILVVGVGLHVYYMRFTNQPQTIQSGIYQEYFTKLPMDPGLSTIAPRLNFTLVDKKMANSLEQKGVWPNDRSKGLLEKQRLKVIKQEKLEANEVWLVSDNIGVSYLMIVRDTYKSVVLCLLYSLFVCIAAFHACNGLWTFAITWGITLSERSRAIVRVLSNALMGLLIFFGLVCIWGVYWVNLRY